MGVICPVEWFGSSAALPQKTLFHELAHIILGHTSKQDRSRNVEELEAESVALLCLDALGLPGSEYCRGYVQARATTEELTDAVASRIMTAADKILRAGQNTNEQHSAGPPREEPGSAGQPRR